MGSFSRYDKTVGAIGKNMTEGITISLLTNFATLLGVIIVTFFSYRAASRIKETHTIVNSRMSELLASERALGISEGVLQGIREEKIRQENKSV